MKLALALLVAGAAAVAPPRIELDLSGYPMAEKLSSIHRPHDQVLRQPNGTDVGSRQDWSQRCIASEKTTIVNCPFPVAKAWDHQDQDITSQMKTRVFRVDLDGQTCGTSTGMDCGCLRENDATCEVRTVDFSDRSTYLFKYDVTDSSGNHAEQVVFALILDDACGSKADNTLNVDCTPVISMCAEADFEAETWEAADATKTLCTGVVSTDNQDSDEYMAGNLEYDIQKLDEDNEPASYVCENQSYETYKAYRADTSLPEACAARELATTNKGKYLVTWKVCDKAGVYGVGARNNCAKLHKVIEIRDTLPPWVQMAGYEPTVKECHFADNNSSECGSVDPTTNKWEPIIPIPGNCHMYLDDGATASDLLDTEALHLDISEPCKEGVHDAVGDGKWRRCMTTDSWVDSSRVGEDNVTYTAYDGEGLSAEAVRNVNVVDTTAPVAALVSPEENPVQHFSRDVMITAGTFDSSTMDFANASGATCTDTCGITDKTPTLTWNRTPDDKVLGDYILTYTCEDDQGLTSSVTRTYTIMDDTEPIIDVEGEEQITREASREAAQEYRDEGATCTDNVHDDLSHSVEVSGQVVNMRIPGVYEINYNCQDLSGNEATQKTRTVTVVDRTCPIVTLDGDETVYVESGFKYVDEGASAEDSLDGSLSDIITTEENTVNYWKAFTNFLSCREIKARFPKATSGDYIIKGSSEGTMEVKCDMDTQDDSGNVGITYKVVNGSAAVEAYGTGEDADQGDCANYGLSMVDWTKLPGGGGTTGCWSTPAGTHGKCAERWVKHPRYWGNSASLEAFPGQASGATSRYLCGFNGEEPQNESEPTMGDIEHALDSTFKISYHVMDKHGNTETFNQYNTRCPDKEDGKPLSPVRTVIVRDTLPPVISLHMRKQDVDGNLKADAEHVHSSNGFASLIGLQEEDGVDGTEDRPEGTKEGLNPAFDGVRRPNPASQPQNEFGWGNKHLVAGYKPSSGDFDGGVASNDFSLMAEQASSSANGWVIGALASAVSGLALLGYSMRMRRATTVEV